MKKILVVALVVTVCAAVAESAKATEADDAIKEVLGKLDRCFAANDAPCVGELFVEDATYVAPHGDAKVVKGKAQIVKVLAPDMAALKKHGHTLTHSLENVRMIDDAHALIDVTVALRGKQGGAKAEEGAPRHSYRGVAVMALDGGTWRCADLRSYVIGDLAQHASGMAADKGSAPPPESAPTPAAKEEPASPTQG